MLQQSNKNGFSHLLILFGISSLVVLILLGVFTQIVPFSRKLNSHVPTKSEQNSPSAIVEASVTSKPSPKQSTPSAQTIPVNHGRSVQIPILTYHYIGNNPKPEDTARDALSVPPDKFDAQIGILVKNGYSFISLDTMYAILKGQVTSPAKPIILTFDDGYVDFYINAFPILRKYNAHAVSFLPSGLIGTSYYMNWQQVKEIDATGLVSFQTHSVHHKNLPSLSQKDLASELVQSKKDLESQLGKPVNFMAYPEGASNSLVWDETEKAGYLGAVGTYYGTTESEGNIYNMPRIKISGSWTDAEFNQKFP